MFVRGGYVKPGNYLYDAGGYGYHWSSVGSGSAFAYSLYFNPNGVSPSVYINNDRNIGYSLRCVALGSRIRFVAKTTGLV